MYKVCDNIIVTDMDDEVVVSRRNDATGNKLIVFNDIGKIIVKHLVQKHTVDEIVDDIHQKTGADSKRIEKDLWVFINQLVEAHIIEENR